MKTIVGFLAMLTLASTVSAESCAERIRKDHPRMYFNADTWPALKAAAKGPARKEFDALLKRCAEYPDNPVGGGAEAVTGRDAKTAAAPIHDVRDWGKEAADCALAWRFTGEKKYLEKARKMLLASVAAYEEAYRNRRAASWASNTRINALCAYDWIWEGLTPDQRREIIVPFVQNIEDFQPGKGKPKIARLNDSGIDTGFYGEPSLLWYSGLAAYGDGFCDELALKHLEKGHNLHLKLLKLRDEVAGDDGGMVSAVPTYALGAYPWAHYNFFHTWLSATGENIAEQYPSLALFPNWIYWTWIPSPYGALYSGFGDDPHITNELPLWQLYEHMSQQIHFYKKSDPAAARLAAYLRDHSPNQAVADAFPVYPYLFAADGDVKPFSQKTLENLPLYARHFKGLGQFLLRSGWREDSTYCTFVAGNSGPRHRHLDENDFIIYKHDFLALDSGSRAKETDYNLRHYYSQTVAHNCILIRHPGEPMPDYGWGPRYNGPEGKVNDGGQYWQTAKVLAFETNGDFTYIASDAAKPYGKKCTEAVRQFVHILPDVFIVYDRVGAADAADPKAWLLHTKNEPKVEGRLTVADCGKGRLFCQTLLPADAEIVKIGGPGKEFWSNGRNWDLNEAFYERIKRTAKEKGRGPYFGEWRIEVAPGAKRADDRFLHVLTATDSAMGRPAEVQPVKTDICDGVKVTQRLNGRLVTATVLFNREGPVGGSIAVNGKSARPLATTIQPQKGMAPLTEVFP